MKLCDKLCEAARLGVARRAEALAGYAWPSAASPINDGRPSVCRSGRSRASEQTDVRGRESLSA